MPDPYQVFAPPGVEPPIAPVARPVAGFFWGRVKAIVLVPALLAFMLLLCFTDPSGRMFLIAWGVFAAPFLVTSLLLFRLHFLPQVTDHPMYTSVANRPMGSADGRLLLYTQSVESAVGLLLLPILAVFAGQRGGWGLAFGAPVFLLMYLVVTWISWVELRLQLADLAFRGREPEEVVHLLEPLARIRVPVLQRGQVRYNLGLALSRVPEPEAAVRWFGEVRGPYTAVARMAEAQLRLGSGEERLAEEILAQPPVGTDGLGSHFAIGALLDLHRGEPDNVVAQGQGFEEVRAVVGPEMAAWHDLLRAAAHAMRREQSNAQELLQRSGWSRAELPNLESLYPTVAAAVRPLLEEAR
jgi:hypothetical protein